MALAMRLEMTCITSPFRRTMVRLEPETAFDGDSGVEAFGLVDADGFVGEVGEGDGGG